MKLPLPPAPEELEFPTAHLHVITADVVLWRVHRTSGEYVVPGNRLRYWGPASTMRFDPHEPPPRVQDRGVSYAALTCQPDWPKCFSAPASSTRAAARPT